MRSLVSIALLMGCASSGGVRRNELGEPAPRIVAVAIDGNQQIGDGELLAGLATRGRSGWFFRSYGTYDPLEVEFDRERIESYYQRHGLFAARVTEVQVRPRGPGDVAVHFLVAEGQPTLVAAVDVSVKRDVGTGAIDGPALRRASGLTPGVRFHHPAYLAAKERLRATLVRQGFAHARVEGEVAVDRDARQARITLDVRPGPLVRFGKTYITGLDRVPESAVRARLAWGENDRFDPAMLELTEGRLYQLGLFASVRLDYDRQGDPGTTDVLVDVSEGARHEIRLGGGLGIDRARWEIRARAGYTHRSFLQPLMTLRLDARPGWAFVRGPTGVNGPTGEASIELERQDLLVPRLRLLGRVEYDVDEAEAYTMNGPGVLLGADRTFLLDRLLLGASWQAHYMTFQRIAPGLADAQSGVALGLADPYRVAWFEQSVAYDHRDDPLDARRGFYVETRLEEGGAWAGGAFDYARATPDLRGYLPVSQRLVLAARVRLGAFLRGGDVAPITQRYYAGGASSHRGFAYRRLAPSLPDDQGHAIPIGGQALIETSVEARLELFKLSGRWLGGAVFLDGADVTLGLDDLNPARLHWAAGAGLRYDTPVGDLRFDVGIRLNRMTAMDPEPGESFALHLTLGEAF